MTREQMEAIADATDPLDGLRVRDVVVGDDHSLYVTLYRGGLPQVQPQPLLAWGVYKPGAEELGNKAACRLLFEAICRFVNTAGPNALERLNFAVDFFTRDAGLLVDSVGTPDLKLIDSFMSTDATYEHLFVAADGGPCGLRWVEGEYVEAVYLADVARDLAEREDLDNGYGATRAEAPEDGQAVTPADFGPPLLGPGDRGPVPDADEGPG